MNRKHPVSSKMLFMCILILLYGCVREQSVSEKDSAVEIFVTTPPHAWLVKEIGGVKINSHSLLKPGDNPHTFVASPNQMMALKKSQIFFMSQMRLEEILIERFLANGIGNGGNNPKLIPLNPEMHDLSKGHKHNVSHAEFHDCAGNDPHSWLNPAELRIHALSIANGLKSISADDSLLIDNNLQSFLDSLSHCEDYLRKLLSPYRGRAFVVFHPSFGHFAEAFQLSQIAIEYEGKIPSPKQLKKTITIAKNQDIKAVFVQPQFDKKAASTIAKALNCQLVEIDPLKEDVIQNLYDIGEKIARSLSD